MFSDAQCYEWNTNSREMFCRKLAETPTKCNFRVVDSQKQMMQYAINIKKVSMQGHYMGPRDIAIQAGGVIASS